MLLACWDACRHIYWSGGFLTADDLTELCSTHPRFAARLIRSHPAWSPPAPVADPTMEQHDTGEPKQICHSATTASPKWRETRDQYHRHLFACPACYAPAGRYCVAGAELHQRYNQTLMEPGP